VSCGGSFDAQYVFRIKRSEHPTSAKAAAGAAAAAAARAGDGATAAGGGAAAGTAAAAAPSAAAKRTGGKRPSYLYGFVNFRQCKDKDSARGYMQVKR